MFTIDNKLQDLQVKQRSIYKILYSMNSHPVATPEMSVEEARCYILFFSEGTNLSAFIGLYLPGNDRKFFYAYNSNPFPFEAAEDVENEARQFAEDMGFLLDEINVSGMAPEDRNHWIEDQYIFGYKQPELQEEEEPEPFDDVPEEVEEPEAKQEAATKPDKEEAPGKKEEPDRQGQPVASAPPQTAAPSIQEPVPPPPAPAQPAPPQAAAPSIQEPVPPPPAPAQPAPPPQQQPAPANYPQAPGQPQHPYPGHYPQQGPPYAPPQPYPGYPQQGPPYAPPQPYPGYPQQGQPYMPPQPYPGYPQPMPPQYPPMQPAPELDVPELEEPEAPARAKTGKQRPAEKTKRPAFRSPPPSLRRPVREEEEEEEELTTEVESETAPIRPPQRAAETTRPVAGKKPILRTTASAPGKAGTVTRDKEALARLLSSF